eukprot:TRINITY_DN755_c0_g1_i1.p1 TRINITY_DN755_c0_g1~~TRINITY_DN755_c0_g1_i1.p1  ORF type:complete len:868 (-),score=326.69 TRINITY_DN755_c0_g1_i1:69-2672(-)
MNRSLIFIVICLFVCCYSQSAQVFYTPNIKGINTVYSINISSSDNITLQNVTSTQQNGDGVGLSGISRASSQNSAKNERFVFISNEGSQSISVFGYNLTSGELILLTNTTVIDPSVQKIEDIALATSVDGKYLFVGASHFLNPNFLISFSIDQTTGSLTPLFNVTFGNWEDSPLLPLRIASVTVSQDGKYVFVGFTSNGGYLGIFGINQDGTLTQKGNTKQSEMNGKTSFYTVTNNDSSLLYTAEGNEREKRVGVYQLSPQGLLVKKIGEVTSSLSGASGDSGTISLSLSHDNSLLFLLSNKRVEVMRIPTSNNTNTNTTTQEEIGIPNASSSTLLYSESEKCVGVVGVREGNCGKLFLFNTHGFLLYHFSSLFSFPSSFLSNSTDSNNSSNNNNSNSGNSSSNNTGNNNSNSPSIIVIYDENNNPLNNTNSNNNKENVTVIKYEGEWSIGIESVGGGSIVEKEEGGVDAEGKCCSNNKGPNVVKGEGEIEVSCDEEIPFSPSFIIEGEYNIVIQKREEIESKCNGRPNVVFNITVIDLCGKQISFLINYTRVDSLAPSPLLVGPFSPSFPFNSSNNNGGGDEEVYLNNFYVECGDTVPSFNFSFISVEENCSPSLVTCSQLSNVTRFQCDKESKRVGSGKVEITFYDSQNNSSPSLQSLFIVDTTPPYFPPLNSTFTFLNETCFPDLSLAPNVTASDKCSDVTTFPPSLTPLSCGKFKVMWRGEDECGNEAFTSHFFILPLLASAPQITSLSSNLSFYLIPNTANTLNLQQSVPLTLSSNCSSSFPLSSLFGNEETSVTISSSLPPFEDGIYLTQIFTATWKIVYCGDSSTFDQTITVKSVNSADFSNIIWETDTPRFTIISSITK